MSTVSAAWIASWLLLHALVGNALAAAEGGPPGGCAGTEACAEEASEDDPVALLQARRSAAAAGAVGSVTGEEPAEASHTQAVQTQDPLTPRVGSVAVGGAARRRCRADYESCFQGYDCCNQFSACPFPQQVCTPDYESDHLNTQP
ncbi:unnamed protein product [Polarella glacialis]|nr:unnamed protein product [Polarella glacialis]CAE8658283.1 unnamed protein product [Polarella glacialis]